MNAERLRAIKNAANHYLQDKAITKKLFAEVVTLTSEQKRAQYVQDLFLSWLRDWGELEVEECKECRL